MGGGVGEVGGIVEVLDRGICSSVVISLERTIGEEGKERKKIWMTTMMMMMMMVLMMHKHNKISEYNKNKVEIKYYLNKEGKN